MPHLWQCIKLLIAFGHFSATFLAMLTVKCIKQLIHILDQSCKSYLDAEELYNILTGTPDKVVILDTRARRDYTTSHVDTKKFPQWLSVPEEVITNGNLTAFMSNSGKSIWAERGNKRPLIILVDNDGIPGNLDKISPSDKPPILSLKDKLNQVCSVICLHYVFKLN
jgi:hypothetical protein